MSMPPDVLFLLIGFDALAIRLRQPPEVAGGLVTEEEA